MNRKGYTLAEVLIAAGIVGVLAAVLLPVVNKFKPDINKVMYLKTYDTITSVVKDIAENTIVYPVSTDAYEKAPFTNTAQVELDDGTIIAEGDNKLCRALAYSLQMTNEQLENLNYCKDTYVDNPNFGNDNTFTTLNGVQIMVYSNPSHKGYYKSDIYFDVNGSDKGRNCFYDANDCKSPDRFKLMVSGDGQVIAADKAGAYYLSTRSNWKKNNNENISEQSISSDVLNGNLPSWMQCNS